MPNYLTIGSQVICPHGGQVTLTTSNTQVTAGDEAVLLESDQHVVAGCAFTIGPKPSPCLRVQWAAGSLKTSIGGAPLTQASIGTCFSPEGAPQGLAVMVNTQLKVEAL